MNNTVSNNEKCKQNNKSYRNLNSYNVGNINVCIIQIQTIINRLWDLEKLLITSDLILN